MSSPSVLQASASMRKEYCAKVVRIGKLSPIAGADLLEQTYIDGNSILVPKGMFATGEVAIYCQNETSLNRAFLAANNQYEWSCRELNSNHEEVEALLAREGEEAARQRVGFFNRHGRVRLIKLRGYPSYGCLFKKEHLVRWLPMLHDLDLERYLVTNAEGFERYYSFDTVCGHLFAQAYVPHTRKHHRKKKRRRRGAHVLKREGKMVAGQFAYHYDTDLLGANIWRLSPKTKATISVKLHGTSVIIANILTYRPTNLSIAKRMENRCQWHTLHILSQSQKRFGWQREVAKRKAKRCRKRISPSYRPGYSIVCSSRTVIKTPYINPQGGGSFYGVDVWSEYAKLLRPFIPQGITLYGEICGYATGTPTMFQQDYDYGCQVGENFMVPYRMTYTDVKGNRTEWSVQQVCRWTRQLLEQNPQLAGRIRMLPILYHGALGDIYPALADSHRWNDDFYSTFVADSDRFGFEADEPLCRNRVPREGICLRVDGDDSPRCYKQKSTAFMLREGMMVDEGLVDMETQQNNYQQ